MTASTQVKVNTFGCPGFCSGDANASKTFYTGLFGWEARDMSMEGGEYTMFQLGGDQIAGMYQMADDRKKAGVKPHWNSYLLVENVAETVKRAAELGAKVLMPPTDAEGDLMANLQDPTGVKFSIWEARKQQDSVRLNEPGALVWTELYTPDSAKAGKFYSDLFGWELESFEGGPMPYTIFKLPGEQRGFAGMAQVCEEAKDLEPQWIPYFMVPDADASISRAKELGGTSVGPWDIPTAGRIAMLYDTEGAVVSILKPEM